MDFAAQILVFGDQATDYAISFKRLHSLADNHVTLKDFLRSATETVNAVAKQHASRELIFPQASLLELCEPSAQEAPPNAAVNTVLSCINQLGWLLYEASYDLEVLKPRGRSVFLGVCTGSIAAVAASCSTSISELSSICPRFVAIALQVGLEALRRSNAIDASEGSWALAVHDASVSLVQPELDEFHRRQSIPSYRHAYISASCASSTSVSGPPSTLRALLSKPAQFQRLRVVPLSIVGAFHAEHLTSPDIDAIVGHSRIPELFTKPEASIIFGSGREYESGKISPKALLHKALVEIFQCPQNSFEMERTLELCTQGHGSQISYIGPTRLQARLGMLLKPVQIRSHASSNDYKDSQDASERETDIAVVGMSGRFPGSEDVEGLWRILSQGQDLCRQVPPDRFPIDTHFDSSGKTPNTTLTQFGCFYDHSDLFDALLFHMSPRQASQTDPIQRLMLMATYEALQQAGYNEDCIGLNRIGSFIGQSSDDWREVNAAQNIDTFHIPGGNRAFVSGRINYHFGWKGPAFGIDTACSSSAASIDLACSALLANKCDAAVAGGGNIMTASDIFAGLSRGGLLSRTGSCKTWDETADGYCRADAVGIVVLKRLRTAIDNRDNVLAVIKSSATNHAPQASSITHPNAEAQAKLVNTILKEGNVQPDEVDYVEMHGTGTQAGDVAEASSIHAVFGKARGLDNPLYIGTVKPNVGHGEAASGVTSVIKAITMLQKSRIPRHVGIKTVLNKALPDLKGSNILIPFTELPFSAAKRKGDKRNILVNNFNITSGNTSVLIGDGHQPKSEGDDPRSAHVVTVSAHSHTALQGNLGRMERFLVEQPKVSLSDLAYSTTARRMHHNLRRAYAIKNVSQLLGGIRTDLRQSNPLASSTKPAQVLFIYTGQASQYAGMGRDLFHTSSTFRRSILRSEATCKTLELPSFIEIITSSKADLTAVEPLKSQLALVALEVALSELWQSWGVIPQAVIGHSLGEYPALFVAGVYSLADMFFLVGQRDRLLRKTCIPEAYNMLSVRLSIHDLDFMFRTQNFSECNIACHNSPQANVVAGPKDQIQQMVCECERRGIKSTLLKVPHAFHSAQMDVLLEDFEKVAAQIPFQKPRIPIASTVKAAVLRDKSSIGASYFAQHSRNPVRFVETIMELESLDMVNGNTLCLEIGPGSACINMVKNITATPPDSCLASVSNNYDDWEMLTTSLAKAYQAGVNIKWRHFHQEYEGALRLVELPTYAFDLKSYWIQYEGDWCVRKGRPGPPGSAAIAASSPVGLKSTTLQKIEHEEFEQERAFVIFSTDLMDDRLQSAIKGHLVNESGLCPSSIYADMAITAAKYVSERTLKSEKIATFDVSSMNVKKPLILDPTAPSQIIQVTAEKKTKSGGIKMEVTCSHGDDTVQHADWTVLSGDPESWMETWAKDAYLYQSRIDSLKSSPNAGQVHHLLGGMVYKLFSTLVIYGPKYQGIQEAFLDANLYEATAHVQLQSNASDGDFEYSPYWIDSLAHLSGFVLNGSDTTPQDTVYISHGWDSVRFAQPLSRDRSYTTYVKMQKTREKGVMAGDVWIFHNSTVVGVVAGLRFQAIKKRILSSLLPKAGVRVSKGETSTSCSNTESSNSDQKSQTALHARPMTGWPAVSHLIAAEMGIDPMILDNNPNTILADLGADSLMIIDLQAKVQDQLEIDIPAPFFVRPSTVADLRRYVEQRQTPVLAEESPRDASLKARGDPRLQTSTHSQACSSNSTTHSSQKIHQLKKIIADEFGLALADIEPHANLLDLGVDSMHTLSIIESARSLTGQDIPGNFFVTYPTLADVERFIDTTTKSSVATPLQTDDSIYTPRSESSIQSVSSKTAPDPPIQPSTSDTPTRCSTTLLHFPPNITPTSPTLILFPDGAGSPAPYTRLPTFPPAPRILGLTSPFLSKPSAYTLSILAVTSIYVKAIQQIAPTGPLILGGYSIGGIFAYEAAAQLLSQGRETLGLLLIDSPCPKTIPAIEPDFIVEILDVLERVGTFNWVGGNNRESKVASNVREHFYRNAVALQNHTLTHSEAAKRLPCEVIWARRGVLESLQGDEREKVEKTFRGESPARDWLLKKRRETFGAQGWEQCFHGEVRCQAVDVDHFSLFREPNAAEVATLMAEAVGRLLGQK